MNKLYFWKSTKNYPQDQKYFKTDLFKIFHGISLFSSSNSNKPPRQIPESRVCSYSIYFSKSYCYLMNKCWELHLEFWLTLQHTKTKTANIKIKDNIVSKNIKNELPTFNLSWLSKILATNHLHLKKNLWLLHYTVNICIYNNKNLSKNFIETPMLLLWVSSKRGFLG